MPRKRCCGWVDMAPDCRRFVPDSATVNPQQTVLHMEEMEALRLKDLEGLEQGDCAVEMGLSRPTFQRVLRSARQKVAEALLLGNVIIIDGGNYKMKNRVFECVDCAHVWEVAPCSEGGKHGYEIACPNCGSMKKLKLDNGVKHACAGGHGHGGGGCCGGHGH